MIPPEHPEHSRTEEDLELEERLARILGQAVEHLGDLYHDERARDFPDRVRGHFSEWYYDTPLVPETAEEKKKGRWRHTGGIGRLLYTGVIGWISWRLHIPHFTNHQIWDFAEQGEGVGGGMVIGCAGVLVCVLPAVWSIRRGRRFDDGLADVLRHRVTFFAPLLGGLGSVPLAGSILGLALYTPGLGVHL
ncbi:hypothetical protein [Streptomyces sp. NPDC015125]|uniref:hypothetical protein n=1 Tax=Streptomyces sp. NPDC015125 TaxID=3364938 RepID=UPI0036F99F6A